MAVRWPSERNLRAIRGRASGSPRGAHDGVHLRCEETSDSRRRQRSAARQREHSAGRKQRRRHAATGAAMGVVLGAVLGAQAEYGEVVEKDGEGVALPAAFALPGVSARDGEHERSRAIESN